MVLSMQEYLLNAHKLLSIYGYNCHKKDEDSISFVASAMMQADQTWDGKSSSIETWRFTQAKFAIMKLKTKHRNKRKIISLSTVVNHQNNAKSVFLSDILEDKAVDNTQIVSEIFHIAKNKLSQTQFECIKAYYCDDMTMDNIGAKLGITRQAVSLSIKKAINIIKHECQNRIDYTTR